MRYFENFKSKCVEAFSSIVHKSTIHFLCSEHQQQQNNVCFYKKTAKNQLQKGSELVRSAAEKYQSYAIKICQNISAMIIYTIFDARNARNYHINRCRLCVRHKDAVCVSLNKQSVHFKHVVIVVQCVFVSFIRCFCCSRIINRSFDFWPVLHIKRFFFLFIWFFYSFAGLH